jgi:hypothetical protein
MHLIFFSKVCHQIFTHIWNLSLGSSSYFFNVLKNESLVESQVGDVNGLIIIKHYQNFHCVFKAHLTQTQVKFI